MKEQEQAAQEPPASAVAGNVELVTIAGGVIEVRKWSLVRLMEILQFVGTEIRSLSPEQMATFQRGSIVEQSLAAIELLGQKLPAFLELCVAPEFRSAVQDLSAEDALALLVAIYRINLTEGFRKNVRTLLGALPRASGTGK